MYYDLWIISKLILPQNPMGKYEEKLYLEYLLKNSSEKIEDMIYIYIICLEYLFKNPGGENQRYDIKRLPRYKPIYEKNLNRKTHLGKEYNYII